MWCHESNRRHAESKWDIPRCEDRPSQHHAPDGAAGAHVVGSESLLQDVVPEGGEGGDDAAGKVDC